MEIVITDIDFNIVEVTYMTGGWGAFDITEDASTANIHFYVMKNGNKLSGTHEVPFEQYRKMNHDDAIKYLKELYL